MKDILIEDRYRVDRKLGRGGTGLVYSGVDLESNEEVAIKLMPKDFENADDIERLSVFEWEVLLDISGGIGMPRARWFGEAEQHQILIFDCLGPTLDDLLAYCGGSFTLKTILLLADQAISRIQHIHNKGYTHCDIKPDNFLMGVDRQGNVLHVIDFGLARIAGRVVQAEPPTVRAFQGTPLFASINTHNRIVPSFRDDLESLGYCLIYLLRGSLPWEKAGEEAGSRDTEPDKPLMREVKTNMPLKELCEGLPQGFLEYLDYTRSLSFGQKPDYRYLRQLFRRRFISEGFRHDYVYDWTLKLFNELRDKANHPIPEGEMEE